MNSWNRQIKRVKKERPKKLKSMDLPVRDYISANYQELMSLLTLNKKEECLNKIKKDLKNVSVSDKFYKEFIMKLEAMNCEKEMFYITNVYLMGKDLGVNRKCY